MIGHRLRPAGVLRECCGRNFEALRQPRNKRIDRLLHVRQAHAGMPQQRKLHGEAQPIRVATARGQKLPIRSGEAVEARQRVRASKSPGTPNSSRRPSSVSSCRRATASSPSQNRPS